MTDTHRLQRVTRIHTVSLLTRPNVVGVGTGYKTVGQRRTKVLCIVALVRRKVPTSDLQPREVIPAHIEGVPTDVLPVGELRILQAPTDRWRPAPGGVSIGHRHITAGTLGVVVRDRAADERLILSNNHVLANCNDAEPGDPILQPGPADGGREDEDAIAELLRFSPIRYREQPGTCGLAGAAAGIANALARLMGSRHRLQSRQMDETATNRVDAALARPVGDDLILDGILDIGVVTEVAEPVLGMPVHKSGRTTGHTRGQVTVLDATVDVSYGPGRTARFEGQILTTAMSQGGDSGSLLVTDAPSRAVGLLFGGSEVVTIHNPIQQVLDELEVRL